MDFVEIIILVIAVPLIIVLTLWHYRRANTLLENWAADNDYHIVYREYRWIRHGPFFWFTSKGQMVFHVEILDSAGQQRNAFVRVGGYFWGVWSDNVEVSWDGHRR